MAIPYNYSPKILKALESAISIPRLDTYLMAANADLQKAIELHAWNNTLAAALFGPVLNIELLLRNKCGYELAALYERNDWHNAFPSTVGYDYLRVGQKDNILLSITVGRSGSLDSLALADAAAPANTQIGKLATNLSALPGTTGLRDGMLALDRDSNSVGTVQGMTTGQSSGLYVNDKGLIGQGALAVRESNAGGYAVDLKNAGLGSLAPGAMIFRDGQAMGTVPRSQEIGKGVGFPGIGPGLVGALGLPPVDGVRSPGQGMPGFAGIGQGLVGALGLPPPVESGRGAGQGMSSGADIRQGLVGALQPGDSVHGTVQGLPSGADIGQGLVGGALQPVDNVLSAVQSVPGSAGIALGMGQGITILQPGQGAIKGIDDTTQGGRLNLDGRINLAPTDALTGKKASTIVTEVISTTAVGRPLGLITTKGDKIDPDVIEETKLPQAQTPANQSPLGLGIIASTTTTTTSTQPTGTKDPNTQNTTTATTTGTGSGTIKDDDWANTLPEIEIVNLSEKDNIEPEPVKQAETLTRKEVVIDIDDDDDDEYDQFVVNDGKRGGGAYTPQARGFDNIRGLIEIIIADTAGKKLDDTKANQLFNELFGDNTRRQYIVKPGDTIEEIALRMLKDKRLIPLLLNVNELSDKDRRQTCSGKKGKRGRDYVNDLYTAELKAGLVLELPTRSQILRYKIHVLNDASPLMVYANTLGDAANGAQGGEEANEYIAYTCRLGDTLKSIAKRHPAIVDESKWEVIARFNELTTQCDKNGQPTVVLNRGQKIHLPKTQAVVDELEDEDEAESGVSSIEGVLSAGGLHPPLQTQGNVVPFLGKMKAATVALETKEIAMTMRLITQDDLGDDNSALNLRLEMKVENRWLPVVEYDINTPESGLPSGLKIYDLYGVRQVITLNLPTRAARELAENDITVNSQRYCKLFLTDHQLAA